MDDIYEQERVLFKSVRDTATRYGLPFDLKLEDIVIPPVCPVLGLPLIRLGGRGKGIKPDAIPSVDRYIPELGYIKSNIRVISFLANKMKSNASTQQVGKLYQWMLQTDKEILESQSTS